MAHVSHVMRTTNVTQEAISYSTWITTGFAALMLVVILSANILFWPIPDLGFASNPRTHRIEQVEPDSSADRVGLRVGDRLLSMYNHPWPDVLHQLTFIDWIAPRDRAIPMVVERDGRILRLALTQDEPSLSFQSAKLAMAVLALLCWLTGYILGIVRRHTVLESQPVAFFWLGMSGVLGSVTFALYTALPILVVLVWLVIGVFVPLGIYLHRWFPPRPFASSIDQRAIWYLIGGLFLINGSIVADIFMLKPSLVDLLLTLLGILPFALIVGLGGSGWVLWQGYHRTTIAHTRRQIRLIAVACGAVACVWIVGRIMLPFVGGDTIIPRDVLNLACGIVPLAYLVSAITPDLYRIDRLALRGLVHLATITVLGLLLMLITNQVMLRDITAVMVLSICLVALYRPVQHGLAQILSTKFSPEWEQRALDGAISGLAETLEAERLATTLIAGVREAFGQPALALFLADTSGSNALTLCQQERLEGLPGRLPAGALTDALCQSGAIIDSKRLQQRLHTATLMAEEQDVLSDSAIMLWCPIRHSAGHLLGLLLLGMRGDFDPYRQTDYLALQRLLSAAALAFAHSAAYAQRQEAEQTIRQLYRRLQTTQDATAREITREIHDELINVDVRLNIQSLKTMAAENTNPALDKEITLVLESQQTMGARLRRMCENLHPTGLDDPLGLPAVLRAQCQKVQARWQGQCLLQVTGTPLPVAPSVQQEALRITKEALANAIKHANASRIVVHLQYPTAPHEPVTLNIEDNGNTSHGIVERPGHLGVRYMQESARAGGGSISFERSAGGGSAVVFTFSPAEECTEEDGHVMEGATPDVPG